MGNARTRLKTGLMATSLDPRASGNAKWERRCSGGRIERDKMSVEVEDVSTAGNYQIRLNGTCPGLFVSVNQVGFGDLNLDTRNGQTVPELSSGDEVEVLRLGANCSSGNHADAILRGTLPGGPNDDNDDDDDNDNNDDNEHEQNSPNRIGLTL